MPEPFPTELLYFESLDLLRRRFERHHDRALSAGKAREIASHFRQGREFHETAGGSPLLVKPLLLYYAVLAWTRGLVLFRDASLRESGLKGAHGVAARDWQAALARKGATLGDLQVRCETGTFAQLALATQNTSVFRVQTIRPLLHPGTAGIPPGSLIAAKDIWGRLPELAGVYEETFAEPSCVYREHEVDAPRGKALRPASSCAALLDEAAVRASLRLPDSVTVESYWWREGPEYTLIPRDDNPCGWTDQFWGGDEYIFPPLPGDLRLSLLSLMYLNAYILGMLVRYYPTRWADLVHRGLSDGVMPLVREATALTETRFPRRLLAALALPRRHIDADAPGAALDDR